MKTIKSIILSLFVVVANASTFASEVVADRKWWAAGGQWYYLTSSMQNLLVDNVSGDNVSGLYRRSGEILFVEAVPDTGHVTGSYFFTSGGTVYFARQYAMFTDYGTNRKFGKYAGWIAADETNGQWTSTWLGMSCCINLQASNGQWVCAENGGGSTIVANRPNPASWEEFTLWGVAALDGYLGDGDEVVLGTRHYGTFVCAEGGGGQPIVANRTGVGAWERFIMRKVAPAPGTANDRYFRTGDKIALVASNGQFWSADWGGGSQITANRDGYGEWETFTLKIPEPQPY